MIMSLPVIFVSLLLTTGIVVSVGSWVSQSLMVLHEEVRLLRIELQSLKQQEVLLNDAANKATLKRFPDNRNQTLLGVIEMLGDSVNSFAVDELTYEISELNESLDIRKDYPVSTQQISVRFKTPHAIALLNDLEKIRSVTDPWPAEFRACEVHRMMGMQLSVYCKVHYYQWWQNEQSF